MRILAIDTSTWWGSVALVERPEPGGVTAELGMQVGKTHASALLSAIERLLEFAGWPRSSVGGYVATRGPGSFTGLRVGLGTITGRAWRTIDLRRGSTRWMPSRRPTAHRSRNGWC